mmetsp:Transcript_18350/g.43501  ORF Transcript_18350/g.43501 Transcript_18350/m.43501 type:complete len:214 (-) Transcript_18350:32-673(-)
MASMLSTPSPWREASSSAGRPSSRKSRRKRRLRAITITNFGAATAAASPPSKRATASPPTPPSGAAWPAASPKSFLSSGCPPASPSSLSRRVDSASSFANPRTSSTSNSPVWLPSSTSAQLLASCWAAEPTLAFGTSSTVAMRPCRPSVPTACPMSVPPTPSLCRTGSARSKRWLRPCSTSLASAIATRGRLGPWAILRATSRLFLPWCFGCG